MMLLKISICITVQIIRNRIAVRIYRVYSFPGETGNIIIRIIQAIAISNPGTAKDKSDMT